MQNRLLIAGAVSMVVAILFLAAGAIPVHDGHQTVVFQTPAFLLVAACGGLLMLAVRLRITGPAATSCPSTNSRMIRPSLVAATWHQRSTGTGVAAAMVSGWSSWRRAIAKDGRPPPKARFQ